MIPTGGKINGCAERKATSSAAVANSENGLSTASEWDLTHPFRKRFIK
jgi:hypothetical protein